MPRRKDLRVISGGKSGGTDTPCGPHPTEDHDRLLQKVEHYRNLAAGKPGKDVSVLIGDLVDAIMALDRMEQSDDAAAGRRGLEYRRLIAELEIEIASTLEAP